MMKKRTIDHIVYAVPNLEQAIDKLEEATGVRPVFGGYHTTQGTKNALLGLGRGCYLEILAADNDNKSIKPLRWMGIDLIEKPQISRWSLKSSDLEKDSSILKFYQSEMGKIQAGQRKMTNGELLKWEMIMPLATPVVDIVPFMTDWQQSAVHPSDQLTSGCRLNSIEFEHPKPVLINKLFENLEIEITVTKGNKTAIRLNIQTPLGEFIL